MTSPLPTSTLIRHITRIVSATLALNLGACASIAPPVGVPTGAYQAAHSYHETIDLKGRLSLRYERNGKEEAIHGSFEWAQMPGHVVLTLLSPLGQVLAKIDITPGSATLTQANLPPRSAADADALIADTLGWPLPVSGLRDWLQGFAVDAGGKRIIAAPQANDTIATCDGWRLRYVAWETDPVSNFRPKRIDIERPTAQAGEVAARIVIDEWQAQ